MKVVCDTGAIITLEKLKNGFELIGRKYSKIIIPPAVIKELAYRYHSPGEYLKEFKIEDFIEIIEPIEKLSTEGFSNLQKGEQEAISLAKQLNLELLIEEKTGRLVAEKAGIQFSGIAGQILKLYHRKLINKLEYKEILSELYQKRRLNKFLYQALQNRIE